MYLLYTLQALILKIHTLSQIIHKHLKQRSVPAWRVIRSLLPESPAAFGERGAGNPGFICIYEQTEALVVLNWSLTGVRDFYSKTAKLPVLREQASENKHHSHCFADVTRKDPLNHCIWKATFNSHFSVPLHCQCRVMNFSLGKDVAVVLKEGKRKKMLSVFRYFTSSLSPWPYPSGLL